MQRKSFWRNMGKHAGRVLAVLGVTLALTFGALYGAMWILVHGPSPAAGRLFILSVRETSAAYFLADWFLSPEEIAALYAAGDEAQTEEVDKSLVQIPARGESGETAGEGGETAAPVTLPDGAAGAGESAGVDKPDVEVVDITGGLYNGILLRIADPSRVFVGTPDAYGEDKSGLSVMTMVKKYDAVAGINAGGFVDPNGTGTGGLPEGIVIHGGTLLWGSLDGTYNIAGIDADGILHVGYMTGAHAMELGIQEAVSWGPALVINGKPCNENGKLGGGLNPRTAIGQCADGTILLLVINGRSADSLGATYDDLVEIMLQQGAVNATNLDGGSSSLMIYEGEYLTESAYLFGERVVSTAFLVRRDT